MKKIHPEMKIGVILENYPQTLEVFQANGFQATSKEDLLDQLDPFLMLKTALKVKGLNVQLFIDWLEEKIAQDQAAPFWQAEEKTMKRLNFLGYTYCPLKLTFKDCFEEVLKKHLEETKDSDFPYFVPSGCGGEEDIYREDIWKVENIDDFPDIIVSAGFGDCLRQEFVDKFVKKGYFQRISYPQINADFAAAGYEDPEGWYTVYSVLPIVMLVDRKKLGNLPVPQQWSDLLNPIYNRNIIIGASHGDIYEDLLLHIYKEHGEEGIVRLAANIKDGLHGVQMAKLAGTANPQGAAIYVIPWIFAKSCPRTEETITVWPADGAIINPMYLLVKKSKAQALRPFVDFVMGSYYGQKSADNYFPVLHSQVDNKLPENASFKWLGWDYIRNHSLEDLKEQVLKIFKAAWGKEFSQKEKDL